MKGEAMVLNIIFAFLYAGLAFAPAASAMAHLVG
jgi:hypothetical protein